MENNKKSMTHELVEWVNRLPDSVKALIKTKSDEMDNKAVEDAQNVVIQRGFKIVRNESRLQAVRVSSGGNVAHATYDFKDNKFHIHANLSSLEEIEDLVELLRAWRDAR